MLRKRKTIKGRNTVMGIEGSMWRGMRNQEAESARKESSLIDFLVLWVCRSTRGYCNDRDFARGFAFRGVLGLHVSVLDKFSCR